MKKTIIILISLFLIQNSFSQKEPETVKVRKESSDKIYTIAGIQPSFKGGDEALYKYLSKNISYPDSLRSQAINGKVYCKFVVEKDGSITNVEIMRSPNPAFSEIVLKAIRKMPNWNPGITLGKKVRVQYVVPVHFNLK